MWGNDPDWTPGTAVLAVIFQSRWLSAVKADEIRTQYVAVEVEIGGLPL